MVMFWEFVKERRRHGHIYILMFWIAHEKQMQTRSDIRCDMQADVLGQFMKKKMETRSDIETDVLGSP